MRETFLQRLQHAADSLRELLLLSGEDVCLWLSIGPVGRIVNGCGLRHTGFFLSCARGGALSAVNMAACEKRPARGRSLSRGGP